MLGTKKAAPKDGFNFNNVASKLAERVGFEPTVGLHQRLISSQVHSTTLPPLQKSNHHYRRLRVATAR